MKTVCITGGIGAGKSVVSMMLRLKGYAVYDCDSQAKMLMQADDKLKQSLIELIGDDLYDAAGRLQTKLMASRIFNDSQMRQLVNALVHKAVRDDIADFATGCGDVCFVETAIPHTARIDLMCDEIWMVDAPEELRIVRAARRDGATETQILSRIEAQRKEFDSLPSAKCRCISNDGSHSLIEQVDGLLQRLL